MDTLAPSSSGPFRRRAHRAMSEGVVRGSRTLTREPFQSQLQASSRCRVRTVHRPKTGSIQLQNVVYLISFCTVILLSNVRSVGADYGYSNQRARVYAMSTGYKDYKPLREFLESLLLDGYEKRIRPFFKESPLEVHVNSYIIDLLHVDEIFKEITFDLFLREYWIDPRLAFKPRPNIGSSIHLDPEHSKMVWQPDTFVVNERKLMFHEDTVDHEWIRIKSNGELRKSTRRALTTYCYMGFRYYPFDRHRCDLELESFSYTTEDIQYEWKGGTITPSAAHVAAGIAVNATNGTHVPFRVMSIHARKYHVILPSGNFSRLAIEITIQRYWGVFVSKFFIPSFLFVIVALISLWIRHLRFAFILNCINLIFYIIFLFIPDIGAVVPYTDYYKAPDVYRIICIIYLLITFFITLAVLVCGRYDDEPDVYKYNEPRTYIQEHDDLNPDEKSTMKGRSFLDELSSRGGSVRRYQTTGTQTYLQSAITRIKRLCHILKWVLCVGFLIINFVFWFLLILLSQAYKIPEQLVLVDNDF